MADIDLGKVTMTEEEVQQIIDKRNEGVRLGKDADGNPGYYKFDESAGADTLIPFSLGGAGGITGIKKIGQLGGTVNSGTSSNFTLDEDYKAIIAYVIAARNGYSIRVTGITLPNKNTALTQSGSSSAGNGYYAYELAFDDSGTGMSKGNVYPVSYKLYYTGTSSQYSYCFVYGVY